MQTAVTCPGVRQPDPVAHQVMIPAHHRARGDLAIALQQALPDQQERLAIGGLDGLQHCNVLLLPASGISMCLKMKRAISAQC